MVVQKEGFTVVGLRRVTPRGGGTWELADGVNQTLEALCGHGCDLGLCFGFGADGSNDYMCGVEWNGAEAGLSDICSENSLDCYTFPPAGWMLVEARGKISEHALDKGWTRANGMLLASGYKKAALPTVEKYISWDNDADSCHVQIWIPVEKR